MDVWGRWGICLAIATCLVVGAGSDMTRAGSRKRQSQTEERQAPQMTARELRSELMRFADRFAARTVQALLAIEKKIDTAEIRNRGLEFRVYSLAATFELAISPDISTALLDLLSSTTLTRLTWEDQRHDRFGPDVQPMIDVLRDLEQDVYAIGARTVSEQDLEQLRETVERWHRDHPEQTEVSHIRLSDLGQGRDVAALKMAKRPGGFFGVGKAVEAVEETQELLERAVWFATRLQLIAGWEAELTFARLLRSRDVVEMRTEVKELVGTLARLPTDVSERSLQVSREVMREITVEREAAIKQAFEGLAQERSATLEMLASEKGPRGALVDTRRTIEATNELVARLDALLARLEPLIAKSGGGAPPGSPSRPFDINEYRQAIAEMTGTIERTSELLGTVDRILASPAMERRIPQLYAEGRSLVRSLFRAGLALIAILLAGLLAVLVAYRWIAYRMSPGPR